MTQPTPTTEPRRSRPAALARMMLRLEANPSLDAGAAALEPLADALVSRPAVRRLLQGRALGHALHPLLTDVPIGAWLSATVLDLTGGEASRQAAQRLVGVGILAALPTAVTGLAEWASTDGGARRVGVAHALSSSLALALCTASWQARRRDRHTTGQQLSLAAGAVVALSGYLGGHLAVARKAGTRDPALSGTAA